MLQGMSSANPHTLSPSVNMNPPPRGCATGVSMEVNLSRDASREVQDTPESERGERDNLSDTSGDTEKR